MTETFEPLYDRILVRPVQPQSKTESGLLIPDVAQDKSTQGEVVAIGCGYQQTQYANNDAASVRFKLRLNVGDRVLYTKHGNTEVTVNGEKLLLMKESDVLGRYNG